MTNNELMQKLEQAGYQGDKSTLIDLYRNNLITMEDAVGAYQAGRNKNISEVN